MRFITILHLLMTFTTSYSQMEQTSNCSKRAREILYDLIFLIGGIATPILTSFFFQKLDKYFYLVLFYQLFLLVQYTYYKCYEKQIYFNIKLGILNLLFTLISICTIFISKYKLNFSILYLVSVLLTANLAIIISLISKKYPSTPYQKNFALTLTYVSTIFFFDLQNQTLLFGIYTLFIIFENILVLYASDKLLSVYNATYIFVTIGKYLLLSFTNITNIFITLWGVHVSFQGFILLIFTLVYLVRGTRFNYNIHRLSLWITNNCFLFAYLIPSIFLVVKNGSVWGIFLIIFWLVIFNFSLFRISIGQSLNILGKSDLEIDNVEDILAKIYSYVSPIAFSILNFSLIYLEINQNNNWLGTIELTLFVQSSIILVGVFLLSYLIKVLQ